MSINTYRSLAVTLILLMFLPSCQEFKQAWQEANQTTAEEEPNVFDEKKFTAELEKPVYGVISIHTMLDYSEGTDKELSVPDFFGGKILVEATPWLTSKDIEDIIPVERPTIKKGVFDLKLVLNANGLEQWKKMLDHATDSGFAVLVDGTFYQTFRPRRLYSDSSKEIVLEGPFDETLAHQLNLRAPFNYLKLNKSQKK